MLYQCNEDQTSAVQELRGIHRVFCELINQLGFLSKGVKLSATDEKEIKHIHIFLLTNFIFFPYSLYIPAKSFKQNENYNVVTFFFKGMITMNTNKFFSFPLHN